ncbi:MAG: DUF5340 domain-containing protein [Synechococcales cyanobacterium RM1_1_8]|nr:DUF5340 domain-containing protein [Synechococcales cyanobacterium RM1_1_8]
MDPIPLPSPIHYEVPLRLLEQQASFAVAHHPTQRQMMYELIATLRKAMSQQKRLEESCSRDGLVFDHRWGIDGASFGLSSISTDQQTSAPPT